MIPVGLVLAAWLLGHYFISASSSLRARDINTLEKYLAMALLRLRIHVLPSDVTLCKNIAIISFQGILKRMGLG